VATTSDRPGITVVGLGPGDPALITEGARRALDGVRLRFTRTRRHPSAGAAEPATSFDEVYEAAASIDEVYPAIVERLVAAAADGPVAYAVPGSPFVAERTVELLRADPRVDVAVQPAVSFVDLAWDRVGVDPFAVGARLVDGHRFAAEAAGRSGPFLVAQTDTTAALSDIKLAVDDGPPVVLLHHLGLPDERVEGVAWADLDRTLAPDHLTCLWIPGLAEPVAAELVRFEELVRTLRARCPWDREQTHATLRPYLVEEAYEVLEALDTLAEKEAANDPDLAYDHLEEELGDLLFQVFFHAVLAGEQGRFTVGDVARGIHDKLVRRHPHVFAAPGPATDAAGVAATWDRAKREEKGRASLLDGIPPALPALQVAAKLGRKAGSAGFDWPDTEGVRAQVTSELDELAGAVGEGDPTAMADELGDVLFSVAQLGRRLGVDPEGALRGANRKFRRRFQAMEAAAGHRGIVLEALDPEGWERLWAEAKRA
jgi:tetrapyrrole methylase family protein/MazG family protein